MRWFYVVASAAVGFLARILCRLTVEGRENVPAHGPLILVANHLSLVDPPLLGAVFPRPIRFMAKEELFHTPIMQWIVAGYLAFPIRRGEPDRQALQTTLNLLKAAQVVGVFPEGTRSRSDTLAQGQPGVALIALRSRAPIIPVAITGTEQIFRWPRRYLRPPVTVRIGRPFTLPPEEGSSVRAALGPYTNQIMNHIAELLPESYRGVYGSAGNRTACPG